MLHYLKTGTVWRSRKPSAGAAEVLVGHLTTTVFYNQFYRSPQLESTHHQQKLQGKGMPHMSSGPHSGQGGSAGRGHLAQEPPHRDISWLQNTSSEGPFYIPQSVSLPAKGMPSSRLQVRRSTGCADCTLSWAMPAKATKP